MIYASPKLEWILVWHKLTQSKCYGQRHVQAMLLYIHVEISQCVNDHRSVISPAQWTCLEADAEFIPPALPMCITSKRDATEAFVTSHNPQTCQPSCINKEVWIWNCNEREAVSSLLFEWFEWYKEARGRETKQPCLLRLDKPTHLTN